jgi:hypothetical protein
LVLLLQLFLGFVLLSTGTMFRPPPSPDEKTSGKNGGRKPMLRQLTEALHRRLLELEQQAAQPGSPGTRFVEISFRLLVWLWWIPVHGVGQSQVKAKTENEELTLSCSPQWLSSLVVKGPKQKAAAGSSAADSVRALVDDFVRSRKEKVPRCNPSSG